MVAVATPWQVLGMAPTNDKKAIKRAYAEKLKRSKPDEDPEGFQQLHHSYKHALAIAPHLSEDNEETPDLGYRQSEAIQPESFDVSDQTEPMSAPAQKDSAPAEKAAEPYGEEPLEHTEPDEAVLAQRRFEQQWASLVEPIDAILKDHLRRNKINQWQALTGAWDSLTINQMNAIGLYVFDKLSFHNSQCKGKRKKYDKVTKITIIELNQIFLWDLQESHIRYHIDDDKRCDSIFKLLTQTERDPLSAVKGGAVKHGWGANIGDNEPRQSNRQYQDPPNDSGINLWYILIGMWVIVKILYFIGR